MAVPGTGGIVMFITLKSTPGSKQRSEPHQSCVAPGAGWSLHIPPLWRLNFCAGGRAGHEGFPAPAAGHRDTCQSKSSTGHPPA